MSEYLIGVTRPGFTFDADTLTRTVRQKFPTAQMHPITTRGEHVLGQMEIPVTGPGLIVVMVHDDSLLVTRATHQEAAALMSQVTELPGFPDDESVVLANWAPRDMWLRPRMSPRELLDAVET